VQRVLAAKDEARVLAVILRFLKIWPVFFFVLPGVICVALVQKNAFGGAAPQTAADTYTFLITHLLPIGLKGSLPPPCWPPQCRPVRRLSIPLPHSLRMIFSNAQTRDQDHQLVTIGKVTTVLGTILAIVASPLFGHYTDLRGHQQLISMLRHLSPQCSCLACLETGLRQISLHHADCGHDNAVAFYLDWNNIYRGDFMLIAFLLVACLLIMVATTFRFPEALKPEAKPLIWEDGASPCAARQADAVSPITVSNRPRAVGFAVLYLVFIDFDFYESVTLLLLLPLVVASCRFALRTQPPRFGSTNQRPVFTSRCRWATDASGDGFWRRERGASC
jgi:SSS family solute:Na+ symporter